MVSLRTQLLLVAATLLTGLLAGGVVDRAIVGGPAWQELGAQAWAQYSRLADLGAGLIAYPIEGIGSTLLTLAATISYYVESTRVRRVTVPLYCAAAFSAAGLVLTTRAAPIMLPALQTKPAVQQAFDQFLLWGLFLRGSADVLCFVALVWALSNLRRCQGSDTPVLHDHAVNGETR